MHPVFPILAQQSPRELERTNRTFKSVLLDAVMGVLEYGWTGEWGADADHIKDEGRFIEGLDAGFSMYTLDVSDDLQRVDGLSASEIAQRADSLAEPSKRIIKDWAAKTLPVPGGGDYTFSESQLAISALVYEKSMRMVQRFYAMAASRISAFDLEVSIDEGRATRLRKTISSSPSTCIGRESISRALRPSSPASSRRPWIMRVIGNRWRSRCAPTPSLRASSMDIA